MLFQINEPVDHDKGCGSQQGPEANGYERQPALPGLEVILFRESVREGRKEGEQDGKGEGVVDAKERHDGLCEDHLDGTDESCCEEDFPVLERQEAGTTRHGEIQLFGSLS